MAATNTYDDLSLVVSLRRQGVRLSAEGDELICRGNPRALTREVIELLRTRKTSVLALLRQEQLAGDLPVLRPDPAQRFAPFPLNENQQAYWLGRDTSMAFGSVGIHVFFELEISDFSRESFESAWNALVARHDMLRARVLPDGTQQVQEHVPPFALEMTSLESLSTRERTERLEKACRRLSHTCYDLEHWPQTTFHAFVLSGGRSILMGSIDCWCLDGHSLQILMRELAALYRGKSLPPAPACSFRDYVLACADFRSSARYRESLAYWQQKIASLPPAPVLPLRQPAGRAKSDSGPEFRRHEARLGAEEFARLTARLRRHDLTLSAFLLACYAETLGHWTYERRFTINVPRINRPAVHKDIDRCVGEFASFSLTAMDLSDTGSTFLDRCRTVQKQVWQDLEHDHVSGVTVLRAWRQHTGAGPETGMPYVFTSEPESGGSGRESSWIGALEQLGSVRRTLTQTPQVWIDAQYGRIRNELHLSWDVLDEIFPDKLPMNMFATYVRLIKAMAGSDSPWQETAPLHTSVRARCTYSVETGAALPVPEEDLLDILAQRAMRLGNLPAITDSRGSMTWENVHAVTAELSAALRKAGLCAGSRVCLLLKKGRWQALAPWAVRAAGGVVVPLDCNAPEARLRALAHDCGASLVLTDSAEPRSGKLWDIPAFSLSGKDSMPPLSGAQPLAEADLFAIIYTSGSTGTPKGVLVPYAGIANAVLNIGSMAILGQDTPSLALSPFHHDMAMPDYMGCLLWGMPLVFPDHDLRKDPEHWLALLHRHKVGFWNSVPAMMTMLMDYMDANSPARNLSSLRLVTLGGDWLPIATVSSLLGRAPQAAVFSIGGPTEISMANISHAVRRIDPAWSSIPYGRPFANTGYQVRNEGGRLCPRGVAGELCCTGPYMSLGYLHDEKRTKASFSLTEEGERLYHTGDMGRMGPDGVIEFLGRRDNQVKMHGYRIELSEIENVLRAHAGIHEAVVLVGTSEQGIRRLCAWIQPKAGIRPEEEEIRSFAARNLPAYMVPSLVGICDAFPLTANGKLDRRAIEGWQFERKETSYTPKNGTEAMVCEAWKQVLGSAPASGQSNFFEAGGDSLSAIRLLNALRAACDCGLSVMDIFRHPAPALLTELVEQRVHKNAGSGEILPCIQPTPGRTASSGNELIVPATHAQTRLWIEEKTRPGSLYILSFRFRITGSIREDLLEQALNRVIARHEALCTSLHGELCSQEEKKSGQENFRVVQHVHASCSLRLQVLHAENPAADSVAAFFRKLGEEAFALDRAPLLRAGLAILSENEAELCLAIHHAVFDGWSMQIFLHSLQEALNEGTNLHITSKPVPAIDYADLGDWEQSGPVRELVARRLDILSRKLLRVRPPKLPDFSLLQAGPVDAGDSAAATIYHEQILEPECAAMVRELARNHASTPFIVGLCAFAILVSRMSGEENLLLGTYAASRGRPELEGIVGLMVNPVPLIVQTEKAGTVGELLALCRTAVMEAADNAIVPFDLLVREVQPHRQAGQHPLFDCAFSQDNTADSVVSGSGMHIHPVSGGRHATAMQLDVAMRDGTHPAFEATAQAPRWTEEALQAFCQRLVHVVRQIVQSPDMPLARVSICPPDEAGRMELWSLGRSLASPWASLWERFEHVAATFPDRVCLGGAHQCTFRELRAMAERIAAALEGHKAPGSVALYLERGPWLVAAMLAVWRCGRCVLPLSRLKSSRRAGDMIALAASSLLVVQEENEAGELLENSPAKPAVLALASLPQLAELPDFAPVADDAPALVLFTSGSSGTPKGVVMSHGTLLNRLQWAGEAVPYGRDERACARADISFIDATTELFGPLLYAIPVSVLSDEDVQHMDRLAAFIEKEGVTRLVSVPSALRVLAACARHAMRPLAGIRSLISSGEALHGPLLQELREMFPNARIFNFYGSTECAGEATWYATRDEDERRLHVPLGRPIAGTKILVRDSAGHVLPWGVPGEIVVQGQALALGYLEENGSPRAFSEADTRTLATGDLGVWSADGQLIGLGRMDRQLKIRGQRLAPQEVEQVLQDLPHVDEACVFAIGDAQDILCACLSGRDCPDEFAMRQALAGRLPQAFIPSLFLHCASFPTTASGKRDMEALKRLAHARLLEDREKEGQEFGTAENFAEMMADDPVAGSVGRAWLKVLGRRPGRRSHFFLDGGHSLLAVSLALEVSKELGTICEAHDIFAHPVLEELVLCLGERLHACTQVPKEDCAWEEV